MPDSAAAQSTVPIIAMADGHVVVRLNRPREHNRLEPIDLTVLGRPSHKAMRIRRSGCSF